MYSMYVANNNVVLLYLSVTVSSKWKGFRMENEGQ